MEIKSEPDLEIRHYDDYMFTPSDHGLHKKIHTNNNHGINSDSSSNLPS